MGYIKQNGKKYKIMCPRCESLTIYARKNSLRCRRCGYIGKFKEFLREVEDVVKS
jgi:ribosomal protein S27AE